MPDPIGQADAPGRGTGEAARDNAPESRHAPSTALIVVNPTSGRGRAKRLAEALSQRLGAEGCRAEIGETSEQGDGERIAREACTATTGPPDCMVACGGDGTIQEVANALAGLRDELGDNCPVMGVAPAGRCNDFARALGIPKDPQVIGDILLHCSAQPIDLGCVNGRYFCTVATLGVDAAVSSFVDRMRMPLRGTFAYIYGSLRVLLRYRPYRVRLRGDFGDIEQAVFLASSANTSTYGGAIEIAPGAVPTDGQLKLCVIDRVSRLRAFTLLPLVLLGWHRSLKIVRFIDTQAVSIEADEPFEIWADGEQVATTPATIEVAPAAVRVLLPPDSPCRSDSPSR